MNVCPPLYETSCTPPPTPPQRPCYATNIASCNLSPPSSPLSSGATSMVLETDTEDGFPLTPNSKYPGGAYHHVTGTSPGAESSRAKHRSKSHHHPFHPYRQPPSFQDAHTFDSLVGRPSENRSQAPDSNVGPSDFQVPMNYFLRHMDELNPASCRFLVHYKAAVRERQRMRLFMTYWELEETNRLRTLLMSLSAEEDLEFRGAERDTQGLLKVLVTEQSLSRTAADVDFLTAVRQRNKTSLRETDAQLDLLEERITQMHRVRSSADGLDNTVGSSPITTDA